MNYKRIELFVFVSNDCNLGCSYCSVLNNPFIKYPIHPQYSIDEFENFVRVIAKKFNKKNVDIYFFGGEPTLNIDYIELVIKKIIKIKQLDVSFILHTNGLLLKSIPKYIYNHLSSIIVSINYENIPSNNLENSYFGRLIDNVRFVKENFRISILARLTITEKVSLYTNVIQISNFFDCVYWQIQNCNSFNDFNKFFSNYKYEIQLLWSYWFNFLKNGVVLNFLPFIVPFLSKKIDKKIDAKYLCGFNDFMIYIQTNGKCFSCAEEILDNDYFNIGDIVNGIEFKNIVTTYLIKECSTCDCYYWCRGRCGRMQERFSNEHIKEYCLLNKELYCLILNNKEEIRNNIIFQNHISNINEKMIGMTEYLP